MNSDARFSRCKTFRYALWREWDADRPTVLMIGLNPSTADATRNDPTIRRCIGFARDWGFGGLWVLNLFAYRATYPAELKAAADPIGPRNDYWIRHTARRCNIVVAAWGNHGTFMDRSSRVREMLRERLTILRLNASGEPAHPLYLPKSMTPIKWMLHS